MTRREFTVRVHHEAGSMWAEVLELPGVFATGDNMDELEESLAEALELVLDDGAQHVEWGAPADFEEDRRVSVCG